MTIRKLLLPALVAAFVAAPAALAQVSLGAKGGSAVGVQAGPVRTQAQVGVDATAEADAVHRAGDAAQASGEQVGGSVKTAARSGAKAADKAGTRAGEAVSGNAKAKANAAVGADAATSPPEPEEEDGN